MKKLAALSVCAALSYAASAQQPGTPDLIRLTANQYELIFANDPQSYELGLLIFAKRLGEESQETNYPFICWPAGVTYAQAAKVIEAYIEQHPQFLNYTMHDIVGTALMQAFPCRR